VSFGHGVTVNGQISLREAHNYFGSGNAQDTVLWMTATGGRYFQQNSDHWYFVTTNGGWFNINGPAAKPGGGSWIDSSDIRIKNVLGKYEHGLAEILKINPIRYSLKGNHSRKAPEAEPDGVRAHLDTTVEYVGVIAQEMETALPETISRTVGYIDDKQVDDLLMYDSSALPYALINAVKELAARVAALENAGGVGSATRLQ
jgi:hypothetical protein